MMNRRGFLQKLSATVATSYFVNIDRARAQLAPLVAGRKRKAIVHATNGRFYRSEDGIGFTSTVLPLVTSSSANWTDIAWNGTVYCAIGSGSACATSTNLASFTGGATPFVGGGKRIIANGSTFVALASGSTNTAAISTDGTTWTSKTLPATAEWVDIAWNGSVYCAIAQGTAIAATSPDATTWTLRTLPSSTTWGSIVWDGTSFVIVGSENGAVATSPDGATWTARTSFSQAIIELQAIGSTIYALGYPTAQIYKSLDHGVSWSNVGNPAPGAYAMAIVGTTYVVTNGGTAYYSTNGGTSWTFNVPNILGTFKSISAVNGYFIITGLQNPLPGLGYSTTGTSWTTRTMPLVQVPSSFFSFAKASTKYCLVPVAGKTSLVSTDGINWSTGTLPVDGSWSAVAWNGSVFCAVLLDSTNVAATSPDGITWTTRTLPATKQWVAIRWNGSVFCALSGFNSSNIAATSPDGITWTSRTLPVSGTWKEMIWNGSVFCAIQSGNGNSCLTSPDGITWTQRTMPGSDDHWSSVVWTGTCFVAISAYGGCAMSPTGATWTLQSTIDGTCLVWNGVNLVAQQNSQYTIVSHDFGVTWTSYPGDYQSYPWEGNAGNPVNTAL